MERSSRKVEKEKAPDYSPLIRAIMYLDEALKKGVVIGIFEGSMEVSDEDITKGLTNVRAEISKTIHSMEQLARAVTRIQLLPGSTILQ